MPLPTTRHFLTNLINRLSSIPLNPAPISGIINQPPNALSRIPLPHRHLIITLHVLFPNLLLPALDLLDRGLVQKLTSPTPNPNPDPEVKIKIKSEEPQPQSNENDSKTAEEEARDDDNNSGAVYVVYSTTPPSRKRKPPPPAIKPEDGSEHKSNSLSLQERQNGQKYIVHLRAWNCTCAAFSFSIVQSLLDDSSPILPELPPEQIDSGGDSQETDWEFGGMSTDGRESSGGVPTCKHLLACLLAERWGDALGEYVSEKQVGKCEMAGVVADV
ncbi:hypothetical protein QBC40DRAFT_272423 [Triangularia verruculosa]|uniref:SWIM-type domain-containing protein n=1 Tax=Triangularia verruculosa TaxID=2587418 RepID=A0AAN6XQQ3_9PEZI|nr:hypothetical protein QBC40DRAFT_272423 [Triangularia verruculosa]